MNVAERQGNDPPSPVPCRLSVLLARDAPIGVIFRRGPSKWTQVIRWRTDEDIYEPGQWFHGRIYATHSDLSPDGRHLLYLAYKEGRRQAATDIGTHWTAISRPPYLTALVLWPEFGSQGAGGVFEDNATVILRREDTAAPPSFSLPPSLRVKSASEVAPEFPWVASARSHWSRGRYEPYEKSVYSSGTFTFWRRHARWRADATKRFILTETAQYRPPYESRTLTNYAALTETPFPDGTTWADFDHRNRLVWTRNGQLFAIPLPDSPDERLPLADATPLADFNAAQPEPVAPPDWAKE